MLVGVNRPAAQKQSFAPRALIRQLIEGPQRADAKEGLAPALPEGVSAERFAALLEVEQAAAIRPGVPRIVENMKRAAIFLEPVNFFSYIYYRFLI